MQHLRLKCLTFLGRNAARELFRIVQQTHRSHLLVINWASIEALRAMLTERVSARHDDRVLVDAMTDFAEELGRNTFNEHLRLAKKTTAFYNLTSQLRE